MNSLLAAGCGAAIVGGLVLLVVALRPAPNPEPAAPPRTRTSARVQRLRRLLGLAPDQTRRTRYLRAAAAVGGLAAWLLTGWPVTALIVPAAVLLLPALIRPATNAAAIRRVEALEEWVRNLQGVITVGQGIEDAIVASHRSAPQELRPQLATLVARIHAGTPTETALRAFAADLASGTGDLIVASLVLAVRARGAGLAQILQGLADTVAQEVRQQREIEADRAKPRTTARWITIVTLVVMGLGAVNTSYIRPYETWLGQLVLGVLLCAYGGALLWMRSMTLSKPVPRFLQHTDTTDTTGATGATGLSTTAEVAGSARPAALMPTVQSPREAS